MQKCWDMFSSVPSPYFSSSSSSVLFSACFYFSPTLVDNPSKMIFSSLVFVHEIFVQFPKPQMFEKITGAWPLVWVKLKALQ